MKEKYRREKSRSGRYRREMDGMKNENATLRLKITNLEDRIAVLEKMNTHLRENLNGVLMAKIKYSN